jgi:hypothetical protein
VQGGCGEAGALEFKTGGQGNWGTMVTAVRVRYGGISVAFDISNMITNKVRSNPSLAKALEMFETSLKIA